MMNMPEGVRQTLYNGLSSLEDYYGGTGAPMRDARLYLDSLAEQPQVPQPDWTAAPDNALYWTCHPFDLTETWWNEPPLVTHTYWYAARPEEG